MTAHILGLAVAAAVLAPVMPAAAQGLPFAAGGEGGEPIEVEAVDSLEWHSELQIYVARGNAVMRQGDTEVRAALLTAHYRELEEGGNEIYRLIAEGGVEIEGPTQFVSGDRAEYDVDGGIFVITGSELALVTETEIVTARDSLEYYEADEIAVARGDAKVVRDTDQIEADVLVAEFAAGPDGSNELSVVNAIGNVLITTETDVASGDEAVYNVADELATLSGTVRLTSQDSQLNGDYAEVDLATGISRLVALPGAEGRVRALLVPE